MIDMRRDSSQSFCAFQALQSLYSQLFTTGMSETESRPLVPSFLDSGGLHSYAEDVRHAPSFLPPSHQRYFSQQNGGTLPKMAADYEVKAATAALRALSASPPHLCISTMSADWSASAARQSGVSR